MKILVIGKLKDSRSILDQCLAPIGHVFHYAENEADGLFYIRHNEVDLILIDMDSDSERADGLIKSVSMSIEQGWIPIIALSSAADDEAYSQAILAGADAMLAKPLNRTRLPMQVIALERVYLARQNLQANRDLIAANLALLKLSMYDEQTGLANRRYFEETLNKELRLARRDQAQLSLLLCEIGSLKRLHETHVRETKPLNAIVSAISRIPCRPADFVSRYDGDVIAVLLPDTDPAGAAHIAEKIKRSVDSELMNEALASLAMPLTLNIAVVTDAGGGQTTETFMADALQALQAAKKTKGNSCSSRHSLIDN